jgi:hypothetical protein
MYALQLQHERRRQSLHLQSPVGVSTKVYAEQYVGLGIATAVPLLHSHCSFLYGVTHGLE